MPYQRHAVAAQDKTLNIVETEVRSDHLRRPRAWRSAPEYTVHEPRTERRGGNVLAPRPSCSRPKPEGFLWRGGGCPALLILGRVCKNQPERGPRPPRRRMTTRK